MKRCRLTACISVLLALTVKGALADVLADCRVGAASLAIEACSSLLSDDPSHAAEWYSHRARALLTSGDMAAALEDANRAIGLNPVEGTGYAVRAQVHLQSGDIGSAQTDAGFAVTLAPGDFGAHLVQGRVLAAIGATDAARRSFEEAARLAPDAAARAEIKAETSAMLGAAANSDAVDRDRKPAATATTAPVRDDQPSQRPAPDPSAEPGVLTSARPEDRESADENSPGREELAFWESVKDSPHAEELEAFLDAYPDGAFAGLARVRIKRLAPAVAAPPRQVAAADPETDALVARCDQAAAHPANTDNPHGIDPVAFSDIDPNAAVASCTAAHEAFPDHDRTAYQLGRAYRASGDVARAATYFRQAAEHDYVRALADLGFLMRDEALRADPAITDVDYFVRAAELGDRISQLQAAWAYYGGLGVDRDYAIAARWFRAAAEQGDDEAQTELGKMFETGVGAPRDYAKAQHWYRLGAEQGNQRAQVNLAQLYEKGLGVPQDLPEAFRWRQKAAERNDSRGQMEVGRMYFLGRGVRKDVAMALSWLGQAARQRYAPAYTYLGMLHETEPAAYSADKAAEYYFLALKAGEYYPIKRGRSWDRQTARALQQRLRESGHYGGVVDGVVGPGTIRAMKALCGCR